MLIIEIFLLVMLVLSALFSVMARSLLKAATGLALVSILLTILIFRLNAPLAAVFELSVCAGLITVVFVSAISLTKPMTHKEIMELSKNKFRRYKYLPVLVILAGIIGMRCFGLQIGPVALAAQKAADVRDILWNMRQLDLFGQVIIILAGAFGVVILFKERKNG